MPRVVNISHYASTINSGATSIIRNSNHSSNDSLEEGPKNYWEDSNKKRSPFKSVFKYVASTGAIIIFLGLFNYGPLHLTETKSNIYDKKSITFNIDNENNVVKSSEEFEKVQTILQDTIIVRGKWQYQNDSYFRPTYKFSLSKYKANDIINMVKNGNIDGNECIMQIESVKNITEEEQEKNDILITLTEYDHSANSYIIHSDHLFCNKTIIEWLQLISAGSLVALYALKIIMGLSNSYDEVQSEIHR